MQTQWTQSVCKEAGRASRVVAAGFCISWGFGLSMVWWCSQAALPSADVCTCRTDRRGETWHRADVLSCDSQFVRRCPSSACDCAGDGEANRGSMASQANRGSMASQANRGSMASRQPGSFSRLSMFCIVSFVLRCSIPAAVLQCSG